MGEDYSSPRSDTGSLEGTVQYSNLIRYMSARSSTLSQTTHWPRNSEESVKSLHDVVLELIPSVEYELLSLGCWPRPGVTLMVARPAFSKWDGYIVGRLLKSARDEATRDGPPSVL